MAARASVATRLRAQLNREVSRRVARAVDVVCDAFAQELEPCGPPRILGSDNYELFYDCCNRLAKYIDANLATTPGFLEQMDRLIVACHSGTDGAVLREVMTKDLLIRRRDTVTIKVEPGQPDISPANSTISREESTRQWGTRKRLSTRTRSRVKRPRWASPRRLPQDGEALEEKAPSVETLPVRRYQPIIRARRRNCVRRMEEDIEKQVAENMDVEVPAMTQDAVQSGNARDTEKISPPATVRLHGPAAQSVENTQRSKTGKAVLDMEDPFMYVHESSSRADEEKATPPTGPMNVEASNQDSNESASTPNNDDQTVAEPTPEVEERVDSAHAIVVELLEQIGMTIESNHHSASLQPQSDDKAEENAPTAMDQESCSNEAQLESGDVQEIQGQSSELESNAPHENAKVDDCDAGTTSEDMQVIDQEQIEKEMRQLVRNLEAGEGSLDMSVARTRFQVLLDQLNVSKADGVPPEPPAVKSDEDMNEVRVLAGDSSESDDDPPVPGLCDARMRSAHQVSYFKARLRKAITFVDAVLCHPPAGTVCSRNCEKIRDRQCSEGVQCRDPICRNWHKAEAHTERCRNPLCEFRNRILLREVMHQIAKQEPLVLLQQAEWKEQSLKLFSATRDEASGKCALDEVTRLSEELGQLEQELDKAKESLDSMKHTRRVLLANLSAIGVTPQDDAADLIPDFESHYAATEETRQ